MKIQTALPGFGQGGEAEDVSCLGRRLVGHSCSPRVFLLKIWDFRKNEKRRGNIVSAPFFD
jgi:hypothetical protein